MHFGAVERDSRGMGCCRLMTVPQAVNSVHIWNCTKQENSGRHMLMHNNNDE